MSAAKSIGKGGVLLTNLRSSDVVINVSLIVLFKWICIAHNHLQPEKNATRKKKGKCLPNPVILRSAGFLFLCSLLSSS
ncbi:MAG: hypothetical protein WBL87_05900, partial [Methanothrix sp.]